MTRNIENKIDITNDSDYSDNNSNILYGVDTNNNCNAVNMLYPFICNLCDKKFKRKYCLINHINGQHTKQIIYDCTICPDKKYFYYTSLNSHYKSFHHQQKCPPPSVFKNKYKINI